jgi:ketosteroid isomerase-like protein
MTVDALNRLVAIEDIRQLKHLYCLHCDRGYEPDAIADLFTEDAVWDGGTGGKAVGRAAIRDFFVAASGRFPYAAHLVTNPIITVDGDSARGEWRMLMPCILKDGATERSAMQCAQYSETYRKVGDRWLIASLKVRRHRMEFADEHWIER